MLSKQFIARIDSALGPLHRVDVGSVADVSEVHAASVFSNKARKMIECSCSNIVKGEGGIWCLVFFLQGKFKETLLKAIK
jgi:hypothetical protein